MTKRRKKKDDARVPRGEKERTGPVFGRRATLISLLVIFGVSLGFFHRVLFGGEVLTGGDVLAAAAVFDDYAKHELARGNLPFWNPYIFGGMPFFESMSWSAFVYPSYWIKVALERIPAVELPRLFFLYLHYLLAGVGMFWYLRSHRVGHAGALTGGLTFMLTPHLVGLATIGHGGKVLAAAYIPLVLMAAENVLRTGARRWVAALGLVGGLQFLARHVQVSYYTWLAVLVLLACAAVASQRDGTPWRRLGTRAALVVGGALLAAALAGMLLIPLREYSAFSTRAAQAGGMGFEQATMWSMHPKELLTFFVPSLFGLANETYWGPMPFQQVSHYMGYVVLCLAAIAVVRRRSRDVGFLTALLVFGLVLSLGKYLGPFYRWLYDVLPGFSRFRVPALFLLLAQFAGAALAGHGVSVVLGENGRQSRWLPWVIGAGAVGLVVGLAVMGARSAIGEAAARALTAKFPGADATLVRQAAARAARLAFRDAGILVAFAAATGVALLVATKRRLAPWVAAALLAAIAVWDISLVDVRFMKPQKMRPLSSYYPETEAVRFLKHQTGPFRIAPLGRDFSSNTWMFHRIESIGGYHPAKLAVFDDLLTKVGVTNLKLLSVLNVRYVVGPPDLDHPAFRPVAPGVHEYLNALPRVFTVGEARSVSDASAMLAEYDRDDFDPSVRATVLGALPGPVEAAEGATAEIICYEPEHIVVEASAEDPCLLVFSEVYYPPGWKAFVDGVETQIYRTDYAFRSVYLEAGDHTVEMRYRPASFKRGLVVSLLAGLVIAGLWVIPARSRHAGATP